MSRCTRLQNRDLTFGALELEHFLYRIINFFNTLLTLTFVFVLELYSLPAYGENP